MMTLQDFQKLFAKHIEAGAIRKKLLSGSVHLQLRNLNTSALSFLLNSLNISEKTLVVWKNHEEAQYLFSDLLAQNARVLFFPSSYRRKKDFDEVFAIQRNETLSTLLSCPSEAFIVVTYAEALAQEVPDRRNFEDDILHLTTGAPLSIAHLTEQLLARAFVQVDFVYEPGQFAVRGGIVDIFGYNFEQPYRLDFFGDEIESIRVFDVETQLSLRRVEAVHIISNQALRESEEPCTLLNYLGECVYVSDDFGNFFPKKLDDERTIEINTDAQHFPSQQLITFAIEPQPVFHKDFATLTDDLAQKQRDGYKIFIVAEHKKQTDRLQSIFDSFPDKEPVTFEPIEGSLHKGFIDNNLKICCYTDHEIFERYHRVSLRAERMRKNKAVVTLKELNQLQVGDYVVHVDFGVGRFGGLMRTQVNGKMQEMIKITYQNNDAIFVSIHGLHCISKYKGKDGIEPTLARLGSSTWSRQKERTKERLRTLARDLIHLYAQRKEQKGFAFSPDSYLQHALEASFIYEDTIDQARVTAEVKRDMEADTPMDRLVCGDVGFGKTEVAMRAAFKAITDNKQVAVLVPTTVLALQHYNTFKERFKQFPVTVEYLSRGHTAQQTKDILTRLKAGKIDVLIGTHKIVGKSVEWHDLGLLIIDEEQKFGVAVKEKIKALRINIDVLTLTATPIPRTLQFSLLGARDLSIMTTPPQDRYPIETEIISNNDEDIVQQAINQEMQRNGQAFIVANRIDFLPTIQRTIKRLCPQARTVIAHGQMPPTEIEEKLEDFINYDYDVLISTTIIESGIDIPNVNTILIYSAQRFGLSDLHQLRGRVGRTNRKAYCYLIAPPDDALTPDAKRRLQALETFSELGSGFNLAMQDLDIRGAGNLLGAEQSGFIADLGYETYQNILKETLIELKNNEFRELFDNHDEATPNANNWVADCQIETDLDIGFPMDYIENTAERVALYKELDGLHTQHELDAFKTRLIDRFGQPQQQTQELFSIVQLRWLCCRLGVEKVLLKGEKLTLYFMHSADTYWHSKEFGNFLQFVSTRPQRCHFKQENDKRFITIDNVKTVQGAINLLEKVLNEG